jgi:hypothetical protein
LSDLLNIPCPVLPEASKVAIELLQYSTLFTDCTSATGGVAFSIIVIGVVLVQPLFVSVSVTVYVPGLVTLMIPVVSVVLHS